MRNSRFRASSLRDAWQEIRPVIAAKRNATEQARSFDALIGKISAFEQVQDLPALITDLNKGFEQMNALFQRAARQPGTAANSGKLVEDDD